MADNTKNWHKRAGTDGERLLKRAAHDYIATTGMSPARAAEAFDRLKVAARKLVQEEREILLRGVVVKQPAPRRRR